MTIGPAPMIKLEEISVRFGMVLVHSPSTIAVPRFESIAHIKKGRAFWPIRRPERVLAGQFDTADLVAHASDLLHLL